jgi:hypothetical protein
MVIFNLHKNDFFAFQFLFPLIFLMQSLQEKVKQLVAVDMQEIKPYNLSQTQTFCLHCSGSPL